LDRSARPQSIYPRNRNHRAENHHDDPDHLPGWGISYKDQELETTFAKHLGVPLLLANVTQQVYQMARAAGLNKEDGSSIIVFERMAGVTIGGDDD
jgi:3-hydroxyisobutyrate dehydrogenase-like beta-hydroxyacid dehydrogenase